MDSLVVMQMAKVCGEESGQEGAGILLGMVDVDRLEVTNCFAFPRCEVDFDEAQYQIDVQKAYRNINIDHLQVGWFQPASHGQFMNRAFLDTQMSYQASIDESVAIVYDPLKTTKGCLSMKAFRITQKVMDLYNKPNPLVSIESLKKNDVTYSNMFIEVPIEVKVSPLSNILLHKLQRENPVPEKIEFLNLSHGASLEQQLRLITTSLDELNQESTKFSQYQRSVAKYNQQKANQQQRRLLENDQRAKRGEAPLPEEEVKFRIAPQPQRIDAMLASEQIIQFCEQIESSTAQGIGRIFMAESMEN